MWILIQPKCHNDVGDSADFSAYCPSATLVDVITEKLVELEDRFHVLSNIDVDFPTLDQQFSIHSFLCPGLRGAGAEKPSFSSGPNTPVSA